MAKNNLKENNSQTGSANTKLLVMLLVIFLIGHAGYNYVPTAYDAESFKQEMQTAILQGMSAPPNVLPADIVKGRIQKAMVANNVPTDAVVTIKPGANISARVTYTKQVNILPFGIYKYQYHFDNTATPTGFLLKDSTAIAQQ